VCFFFSCVFKFTFSTTISSASFPFLFTCISIVSTMTCDCTSYVTLTCILYNVFFGILANTNYTCVRYLSGIWAMALSIWNISIVIWNLGLSSAMIWIVSSLFCTILSPVYLAWGIGSSPLSCVWVDFISSRTWLMSSNSFLIIPLHFFASTNSFVARSCTLFVTI
jgi:hypothetical protein